MNYANNTKTGSHAAQPNAKQVAYESAAPIARFVGHALAVSVGLVLLTIVLLIPVALVKALIFFGFSELGATIKNLEDGLLFAELGFFVVTLSIGALELVLGEGARACVRVSKAYHREKAQP